MRPLNLAHWIETHRHLLKPPVGNQCVWEDREFIVMVVGGPNSRTDYHVNEGEEFFYQLEGEIALKVFSDGRLDTIPIRQGEIFLLPPRVPHSPRRPAGTVGLVVERRRLPGEEDGFIWFCEVCGERLHQEVLVLKDIVKDLPPVFDRFYSNQALTCCRKCGGVAKP